MMCSVANCDKPSRSRGWCVMHYSRWQRHGDPEYVPHWNRGRPNGKHCGVQGRSFNQAKGYWVRTGIVHPLTGKGELSGNAFEHRVVLWDKLECESLDCEHECNWCGKPVTWRHGLKTDHVDEDKTNNDPENLVPSCNGCNVSSRGRQKVAS